MPRHDKSSLSLAAARRPAEFGLMAPATAKEWTRGSSYLHCGVALCGDRQCTAKSQTQVRVMLFRNPWILAHLRNGGNGASRLAEAGLRGWPDAGHGTLDGFDQRGNVFPRRPGLHSFGGGGSELGQDRPVGK